MTSMAVVNGGLLGNGRMSRWTPGAVARPRLSQVDVATMVGRQRTGQLAFSVALAGASTLALLEMSGVRKTLPKVALGALGVGLAITSLLGGYEALA
jgi:hypothetical protein